MKKYNRLLIVVMLFLLSACSSISEDYYIPLENFGTGTYDILQYQEYNSFFDMVIVDDFVEELKISQVVIEIPVDYNVLDYEIVYFNFEVNGYQMCEDDQEIHYSPVFGYISNRESCTLILPEDSLLRDDFFIDKIDIYITFRYQNDQNEGVIENHLYASIIGSLTIYLY